MLLMTCLLTTLAYLLTAFMCIIAPMDFLTILFLVFAVVVLVQLLYFSLVYSRFYFAKEAKGNFTEPVSVVVCAYNEAENLERLIPLLLEQDYPTYEVVVVNDQSIDDTKYVLKQWDWHPKVKVVTIEDHIRTGIGKKFALTLGIKAAQYDHLLLTDADCYPKDKLWIAAMVRQFSQQKTISLGYGAYEKKPSLLNKLIRFDTFQVALQYFSYALMGEAYMGVGRNLSYKKSLFFDNKGFASHLHIPSGDDDLFIREVATKSNTVIAWESSAHTLSVPESGWMKWIRQKTRHMTTSGHYSFLHQLLLGAWAFSQALFFVLAGYLLLLSDYRMLVLGLVGARYLFQAIIYYRVLKRLEERDLFWLFPLWELLQLFFQIIFVFSNSIQKKKSW